MMRSLRIVLDAIAFFALLVLFTLAIDRGWHWVYWRIPVLTLAVYLFSWTLERFPERRLGASGYRRRAGSDRARRLLGRKSR